ncbi:MAG: restriction endonuclease subunit S, partial [Rubrivivax sp.]|nr:restriction endonuclease subunit S [Rubrivivax sp.]
ETECNITIEAVKGSATNIIPAGNVVIATRVGLGKVCLLAQDTAINQDLRGIVPIDPKTISVRFLFFWLKSVSQLIVAEGTGATVQGVKLPFVKSLQMPVSSMAEQQRIVAILDEAFDGIATAKANDEKNLQNARALFESHLQSVFTQGGEGWEKKPMGDVYDVRDGTHDSPKYQATGYPLVTSKNLRRDGLDLDNVSLIGQEDFVKINQRSVVHKGDVLFAMIGTIGNPTLVTVEPNFAIKNVALFKVPHDQSGAFLKHYLASTWVISKMEADAKGTTQKFVGLGYLRSFPIHLPPLKEQLLVIEHLDELAVETQRLESIYQQKLAALDELKKSLLHQAFSGAL